MPPLTMPMKPLDILKKGLDKYSKNIKHRKDEINAKLAWRKTMAIQAHENMEINGDNNVDDDVPPEPCPTHCDVLKAASTINKYIEDSNDPLAQKMEAILVSFNKQLCLDETKNMKETVMTDFFHPL